MHRKLEEKNVIEIESRFYVLSSTSDPFLAFQTSRFGFVTSEKLFTIELPFYNILNHSIHMLESKFMVETLELPQTVIFMQKIVAHRATSKS